MRQNESSLPASFRRLVIAWFAGQCAEGMRFAALPLLTLTTDASPTSVAAVAAAASLPWLLVALPAGILVDRISPAWAIAGANLARAIVVGLLVVAILGGFVSIPLLAVAGFALTTAETFADSGAQTLLVRIVPLNALERANSRFVSSENVGLDLLGPLAAGVLFVMNPWVPFAIGGVIFVVAAGVVASLSGSRPTDRPEPDRTGSEPGPARSTISGAFRIIFGNRMLRSLVITVTVLAASAGAMEGVLVLYATQSIGLSKSLYPTLLAGYSVGLLISAGFVPRLAARYRSGSLMLVAVGVVGGALVLLGVLPHQIVAWVAFATMGAAGGLWNILSASRRQRGTPPHATAAVSSAFRTVSWGAVPIGAAVGGLVADRWGVPATFVLAGVGALLIGAIMARNLLVSEPISEPATVAEPTER
ncbi:Predicted arabinose efflux permease, MFS family [Nakamurella panacisegetis]|uniref:Predicted arabinose efflux permease, MFS family n=1 Tax=Nakamurella panacisegetis TaxID=1090615 RepID=A0A1H0T507_9ACTN|nr:Predicted arabinose efflux permease, MFS family [Nakamurella panacisegetis]